MANAKITNKIEIRSGSLKNAEELKAIFVKADKARTDASCPIPQLDQDLKKRNSWVKMAVIDGKIVGFISGEPTVIDNKPVRSMSLLTINADHHPFMKQFHKPNDEKRSIIVIPEDNRMDWLNCNASEANQFFFEMKDEYVATPKQRKSEKRQ